MSTETAKKPTLKERLQDHVAEYGSIALVVYFSISALTIIGFYVAIKTGADVGDSTAGSSGTLIAAWVAAKITLPIRLGATFILTPIVAAVIHRLNGKPAASSDKSDEDKVVDGSDSE
jgi:hypothetical protein